MDGRPSKTVQPRPVKIRHEGGAGWHQFFKTATVSNPQFSPEIWTSVRQRLYHNPNLGDEN